MYINFPQLSLTEQEALRQGIEEAGGDVVGREKLFQTACEIYDKIQAVETAPKPVAITVVIDGGGTLITPGIKTDLEIPFDCTIEGWTILADQSGSAQLDIWKTTYDNAPPLVADSITAGAPPTLDSSVKAKSSELTDWSLSLQADDIIRFCVTSASDVTRLTLTLHTVFKKEA